MEKEGKAAWQSLTVWLNVLGLVVLVLQLTELQNIMPKEWIPYELAVIAILNVVLRYFKTEEPVTRII